MVEQPEIRTERLILRPFSLDDVDDVTTLVGDRDIASTTLRIPYPYDKRMAEEWIQSHQPRLVLDEGVVFAVTLIDSDQLIGSIGLEVERYFQRAELGYWIGKPFWNHGYATEGSAAVIDYGFNSLGLNRIYASHFVRNAGSKRVMEKNGMKFEGCMRQHIVKWGLFEDMNYYAILREEHQKLNSPG